MSFEYSQQLFDEFPWLQEAQLIYTDVDACDGMDVVVDLLDSRMWANKWDDLERLCRLLEGVSFDELDFVLQLTILTSLRACRGCLNGCYEILYRHLEAQLTLSHYPGKESVLKGLK